MGFATAELVEKLNGKAIIAGDSKEKKASAFKTLFDLFYVRLCSFSMKYVEDKFAAQEIVENTMLILWEKLKN